jgi:Dolichyl-phosphate-mannose-protein mannosyltransferase
VTGSARGRGSATWLGIVLIVGTLVAPIVLMRRKSITYDEVPHLPAGFSYWKTGEVELNPMHPPLVKELCALPLLFLNVDLRVDRDTIHRLAKASWNQREFGLRFFRGRDVERIVFWGRVPAVVLSACLAALVFVWARELWGPLGGLFSLFLYAFDPTIVAHAQLVTTDVGLALFATLFVFLLRSALRAPTWPRFTAAGLALGLALGTKFSAVLLLPVAAILLVAASLQPPAAPPRIRRLPLPRVLQLGSPHSLVGRLVVSAVTLAVLTAIAYAVAWAIYLFPSDPLFYVKALRSLKGDIDPGHLYFFKGQFRHDNWWDYLLVAWLIKTPLPELGLIFLGVLGLAAGERRSSLDEAFLWVPAVVFAVGYSFSAEPIGIRYWIPCFPFVFVATGRVVRMLRGARRWAVGALCALCVWQAAEFIAIWPDHLSYFNQSVGGYRGGLAWLDDSNVDWGQGLIDLRDYLEAHPVEDYRLCYFGNIDPKAYGIRGRLVWFESLLEPPAPGVWILSAYCVARTQAHLRIRYGDGPLNWLAFVEPKAIIGHAYYVYEIAPGELLGEAPANKEYPEFPKFPEE